MFCCFPGRESQSEKHDAEVRRARIIPILDQAPPNPFLQPSGPQSVSITPPALAHCRNRSFTYDGEDMPPPRYEEALALRPADLNSITDEKDRSLFTTATVDNINDRQRHDFEERSHAQSQNTVARPISPRSSIISTPSTRFTDLTSMGTGTTVIRRRASSQTTSTFPDDNTDWYSEVHFSDQSTLHSMGSRPPSYYARSVRAPSRRSISPASLEVRLIDDGTGLTRTSSASRTSTSHPVMADGWFEALRNTAGRRGDVANQQSG